MKKYLLSAFLCCALGTTFAQVPKEIILNTTGYGFNKDAPHGNSQWDYIQKFMNLSHNGQDASVTAVRFYINWEQYEPTLGDYQRTKLVEAIQDLVNLKGGTLKVALHFPYSRPGFWNDSYFPDSTIARIYDGTKVGDNVAITNPSIYSEWARERFYAFVDDALAQLSSFYNKMLYVEIGSSSAEEFSMPWQHINGYTYPGMHDQGAAKLWREVYLPCRYPGQSTVTWDGNTHNISSAPLAAQGQWPSWNTDHGREFHRFASWGLMRFYKGFRDVVKNRSSNLKVLFFVSDFGSSQGNAHHLHNASLPMALEEFDGVYTSEADLNNIQEKIAALDVLKGTNPNKIAAIEFDPTDLGEEYAGQYNILPGVAEEWMARAYKHGADYIHLAMHYHDPAIATLTPGLAFIRANYVNGSYQSPSRQSATTVNIQPTVFVGSHLFKPTWDNLNGNNWSVTDNNPVSINMIDNGYWENIWSCSGTPPDTCDFSVDASGPSGTVYTGAPVTLNVFCSGQCNNVTYSWSGNGISGSGTSVNFNAPGTAGSYTYTVTASKSGCSNKTDTVNVAVTDSSSGPCSFTEKQVVGTWNSLEVQTRQFTINGQLKWTVVIQETTPNVDRHFVRGDNFVERGDITWSNGPIEKSCLGAGETGWGGLGFPSGVTIPSGYIQDTMPDGAVYFELGSTPSCNFDVSPSASNPTPTVSSSVTLNANCSGGDCGSVGYSWSGNGISGSNASVNFNAPGTAGSYTYTVTASKSGCSNKSDTVNIAVQAGSSYCPSIEGDLGVHCYFISGWVYDPNNPNDVLYVDIYDGSTLIEANYPAGDFRQDLLDAGKGNGYHGFLLSTDGTIFRDGNSHNVIVKLAGCNDQIPNSPKTLSCQGMLSVLGDDPTEVAAAKAKQLKVFPNPSNGTFETSFYLERGQKATIVLTDLHGRTLLNKVITGNGNHLEKISVPNKAAGTLFLRLIKENGTEIKKISIVR